MLIEENINEKVSSYVCVWSGNGKGGGVIYIYEHTNISIVWGQRKDKKKKS